MNREPVITIASITGTAAAVIGLLMAFGLGLSDDQQTAIMAVVSVVAPVLVGLLARPKVTPVRDPKDNEGRDLVPLNVPGQP